MPRTVPAEGLAPLVVHSFASAIVTGAPIYESPAALAVVERFRLATGRWLTDRFDAAERNEARFWSSGDVEATLVALVRRTLSETVPDYCDALGHHDLAAVIRSAGEAMTSTSLYTLAAQVEDICRPLACTLRDGGRALDCLLAAAGRAAYQHEGHTHLWSSADEALALCVRIVSPLSLIRFAGHDDRDGLVTAWRRAVEGCQWLPEQRATARQFGTAFTGVAA